MHRKDVYRQVAALHAASIDQGFLATLGVPFLALMYRATDEARGSVLLVEERDGSVMGFVSGGTSMIPIYRRMLRRPFALVRSLLPSIVRPSRMRRIIDILSYGREGATGGGLPAAELLSIAVAPEARGSGVAEILYRRLEAHFAQEGVAAFRITVGETLAPAHRFYRRMGAVAAGRVELHAGQGSTVYIQRLDARVGSQDA